MAEARLWDRFPVSHVAEGWAVGPLALRAHSSLCRNLDSHAVLGLTVRCALTLPGLRDNMDGANLVCGQPWAVTWELGAVHGQWPQSLRLPIAACTLLSGPEPPEPGEVRGRGSSQEGPCCCCPTLLGERERESRAEAPVALCF